MNGERRKCQSLGQFWDRQQEVELIGIIKNTAGTLYMEYEFQQAMLYGMVQTQARR
jgi:hypothetical protein